MKIKNLTNWNTIDLRKLINEVMRRNSKVEGKLRQKKGLVVHIKYSKSGGHSGRAWLHGYLMHLNIPRHKIEIAKFAFVIEHEIMHLRGYGHREIQDMRWETVDLKQYEWAKSFIIRKKEVHQKEKPDLQVKRYSHVLQMIDKKSKQVKRLQNQLKKWNQKRRYYERVLTAAGKIKS